MKFALISVFALLVALPIATVPVAALAKQLGFAPVKLGKLSEGGALVQARGRTWGRLIFQDLFKKEPVRSTAPTAGS